MSIYSKQVADITYEDLTELIQERARENIRLEFKREKPGKDELLKKISSMANTYGGLIIIGIEEDGNGEASSLRGVPLSPSVDQQIIQWCYDGMSPPVTPSVSLPIEDPNDPTRVFYAVNVPMSEQAPHFLNGRLGCYVRTGEYSQRFEPRLATYEEIQHLANRRQRAIEIREELITRATNRLDAHILENYGSRNGVVGQIDTTMWVAYVPLYPAYDEFDIAVLSRAVEEVSINARQIRFPNGQPQALLEGFFFPDPRIRNFAYLEVNSRGLIYYAEELGYLTQQAQENARSEGEDYLPSPSDIHIYSSWILAWLIFYMRYSKHIYRALGYDGPVLARIGLDRIKGRQFRIPLDERGIEFEEGRPLFDEDLSVERIFRVQDFSSNILEISKNLFRVITFSCGWNKAYTASDDFIEWNVDRALEYLMWTRDELGA